MARRKTQGSSFADRFDAFSSLLRRGSPGFPMIAAGAFLVICAVLLLWGVPKLRERLDERMRASTGVGTVEFSNAPTWFDGLRQSQVTERVAQAVGTESTLDPNRLAKARDAILTTGWFHSIEQVRLTDDGGFLVDATFVTPFAVVRHVDHEYLVDSAGRLLPMQWPAGHRPATPHYFAIVGASQVPTGDYGSVWPGADVAAGLELARTLAPHQWSHLVSAIDVSTLASENSLALITSNGGRIVWGRTPGDRSVSEVPVESKIGTLDFLYANHRRIDSGGGVVLDLRGDLVTARPAASARADGSNGTPNE